MSEFKKISLPVQAGEGAPDLKVPLELQQLKNPGKVPVLLLHGLSANPKSFKVPASNAPGGEPRDLMRWLHKKDFEPWLLRWRGHGELEPSQHRQFFEYLDYDRVAKFDIPQAVKKVLKEAQCDRLVAMAHCMGSASLAQSIAAGHLPLGTKKGLTHVVLQTIGLYYAPGLEAVLKSGDRPLEAIYTEALQEIAGEPNSPPVGFAIDTRADTLAEARWPARLEEAYRNWPPTSQEHKGSTVVSEQRCNRLSFMFGQIYRESNLLPEVHRGNFLDEQLRAIPLKMYLHTARNVRRTHAAEFDAHHSDDQLLSNAARANFRKLARVSLITGEQNQVWNPSGIRTMNTWLSQGRRSDQNVGMKIIPGYAHQDLLWGENAHEEVFPHIYDGLTWGLTENIRRAAGAD
jgi:pimeloyl-ACP methyl ester carboxylesterase